MENVSNLALNWVWGVQCTTEEALKLIKREEMVKCLSLATLRPEIAAFEPEPKSFLKVTLLGAGFVVSVIASFVAFRFLSGKHSAASSSLKG